MEDLPHFRETEILELGARHFHEVLVDVEGVDHGHAGLIVQVFRDVAEGAAHFEHGERGGAPRGQVGEEALEEVTAARFLEGEVEGGALDAFSLDQHPDEALAIVRVVLSPLDSEDALASPVLDRVPAPTRRHEAIIGPEAVNFLTS